MARTNVVIDLSHFNHNPDLGAARQAGIVGVIHKATQGTNYVDSTYVTHRNDALQHGLLWGAYHFGTGDDGIAQAEFFLRTIGETPALPVLDFESNTGGSTMSLLQARDFAAHIHAHTGNWPGLYGGSYLKEQLGRQSDPILSNCWFWLAQYGPTAVLPPGWTTWTLWQHTDGHIVPDDSPIHGVSPCDRNYYCGSADDLTMKWQTGSLA